MTDISRIELKDSHFIHNSEFPVAYGLTNPKADPDEIAAVLKAKAETGFFKSVLKQHGAIALRLGNPDPEVMSKYIRAIGYGSGEVPFNGSGSTAQRHQVTDVLTTANENPGEVEIFQHNEYSRFKRYPSTLFFACNKYTAEGGDTPIVHGRDVFDDLQKDVPLFVKELSKRGLLMQQKWFYKSENNTGWTAPFAFGETIKEGDSLEEMKKKAAPLVAEYVSDDFHWDDKNDLVVNQHTKPLRRYESENSSFGVSFNSIATFYGDIKYRKNSYGKTSSIDYDDGEPIPAFYLDKVLQSTFDHEYNHHWEEGDIVIVDNLQVSHGRKPWKGGERKVMVSMWEVPARKAFENWTEPDTSLGMKDGPIDTC